MSHYFYLAGPMRDRPNNNIKTFNEAAKYLRKLGSVFNPAEHEDPKKTFAEYMQVDIPNVVAAKGGIVLLPGWEESEGACTELFVALRCGQAAWLYDPSAEEGVRLTDYEVNSATVSFETAEDEDEPRPLSSATGFCDPDCPECTDDALDPRVEEQTILGETRVVDPITGGAKGTKPERYDLLPWDALDEVAKLYAFGATKYDDHNWRKGYRWGLSFSALIRHAKAFWKGKSLDTETRCHHLASVVFHALTLMTFEREGLGTDDRYVGPVGPEMKAILSRRAA